MFFPYSRLWLKVPLLLQSAISDCYVWKFIAEREYCGFDFTVFVENPQRSSPHI